MTLKQMHAVITSAALDGSLPHQVMQMRQGLANGEEQLVRVEFALEQLAQHVDRVDRV